MTQLDDFCRALYGRSGSDGSRGHAPKRSLLEASNIHAISLIRGAWSKINHRHARTVLLKSRRIDVQNGLGLGCDKRLAASSTFIRPWSIQPAFKPVMAECRLRVPCQQGH
jgi:hypothetical protein